MLSNLELNNNIEEKKENEEEKEKEKEQANICNNELTEKDFNEINNDISKVLFDMKNEKENIEENTEEEIKDIKNIDNKNLYTNENSDNSFKIDNPKNNINNSNQENFNFQNNDINNLNNINFKNIWNNSIPINNNLVLFSKENNQKISNNENQNSNTIENNKNKIENENIKDNTIIKNMNSLMSNNINKNSEDYNKILSNIDNINNLINLNKINLDVDKILKDIDNINNSQINMNNINTISNFYNENEKNSNILRSNNFLFNNNINNINTINNNNINSNYNFMLMNNNNNNMFNMRNLFSPASSFSQGKNNNKDFSKNIINLENILKGKDKRTTLIIRNIPIRYSISILMKELNNKFYHKFDVVYLPQDYASNYNLGFGFINFIEPIHLVSFCDKYEGKKWNCFNSNKRCQLAYSKYQGKNDLIKYIYKKVGISEHGNNKENLKKSFYINDDEKTPKPEIEIPSKFYNNFRNYYPYSLCHNKNNKFFVVDKFYNF